MSRTCRSCGAPIEWATHEHSGRAMPMQADPRGRFVLDGRVAHYVGGDYDGPDTLYVSHFATCPNADRHRKAPPAS